MKHLFILIVSLFFSVSFCFAESDVLYVTSSADDGSEGTLRQVIENALPGDSIVVNVSNDIVLIDEIHIEKDITINGQDVVIRVNMPGVSNHRLFQFGERELQPNVTVKLYNMTLKGGNIVDTSSPVSDPNNCGGCILLNKTSIDGERSFLALQNIKFYNGTANYSGAIQIESYSESIVTNCYFEGNMANSNNAGALYSKGRMLMENCIFKNNSAGKDGAAVTCNNQSTIINTLFIDNHASVVDGSNGGALFNAAGGNLLVQNCTFQNNTALKGSGGFVCSGENTATFVNCTFYGNTMNDAAKGGAAACIIRGDIAFINCTITGNSIVHATNTKSGGIYSENVATTVTLVNTIVTHNKAGAAESYSDYYLSTGVLKGMNNVVAAKSYGQDNTRYTEELNDNISFSYMPESTLFVVPTELANNGGKTPTIALAPVGSVADQAGRIIGCYSLEYQDVSGADSLAVRFAFQTNSGNWMDILDYSDVYEEVSILSDQRGFVRQEGTKPCIGAYDLNAKPETNIRFFEKENHLIYANGNDLFINTNHPLNSFELVSTSGSVILKVKNPEKRISITGIPTGIYIAKVVSDKGVYTQKILISSF